jgi:hypothetical protein
MNINLGMTKIYNRYLHLFSPLNIFLLVPKLPLGNPISRKALLCTKAEVSAILPAAKQELGANCVPKQELGDEIAP